MSSLINKIIAFHKISCGDESHICKCTNHTNIKKIIKICTEYGINIDAKDIDPLPKLSKNLICKVKNCPNENLSDSENECYDKSHIYSKWFEENTCSLDLFDNIIKWLLESKCYIRWFTDDAKIDIRCVCMNIESDIICDVNDVRC
jgi:hypothetical protein